MSAGGDMSDADDQQQVRRVIVGIARAMLDGEFDLVTGCRKLNALVRNVDPFSDTLFNPIIGFESETDHYPEAGARGLYQREYLECLDREIEIYSDQARPAMLDICRQIIAEYDQQE
jgi:hypothetical protein